MKITENRRNTFHSYSRLSAVYCRNWCRSVSVTYTTILDNRCVFHRGFLIEAAVSNCSRSALKRSSIEIVLDRGCRASSKAEPTSLSFLIPVDSTFFSSLTTLLCPQLATCYSLSIRSCHTSGRLLFLYNGRVESRSLALFTFIESTWSSAAIGKRRFHDVDVPLLSFAE